MGIISISKHLSAWVYHFALALSYSSMHFRGKFAGFYHLHDLEFPKHKSQSIMASATIQKGQDLVYILVWSPILCKVIFGGHRSTFCMSRHLQHFISCSAAVVEDALRVPAGVKAQTGLEVSTSRGQTGSCLFIAFQVRTEKRETTRAASCWRWMLRDRWGALLCYAGLHKLRED